ncbi:MAG TPA: ABC transporter permease [Bacteroidales bacterium]|nr:ABC transporter permease [Bacteroidales bacterium]
MIRNYLRVAFRNLRRYPAHSILNITGLSVGMASAILILLWVQDEWSYDRHFSNAGNIYRLLAKETSPGGNVTMLAPTPAALTRTLKEEYPEIIRATRVAPFFVTLNKDEEYIGEGIYAVEKDFFSMFDIIFLKGDVNSAFDDPSSVIITDAVAGKYFGNVDPLGKTFSLAHSEIILTVKGVVRGLPQNSHLKFDFIVPVEFMLTFGGRQDDWNMLDHNYIELAPGTVGKAVESKIRDVIKSHVKESESEIFLQNIKKIHLYSSRKFTYDYSGLGDIVYVRLMSIVAFFIIVIACINFTNLATAQYGRRAKEIGVRKISGAGRSKILFQFLGETLLIVLISEIAAMILIELLLPGYNELTGKELSVHYNTAGLYIGLISVVIICCLTAGSYPAFYLSSLKPLDIVRGIVKKAPSNTRFRRALVIFQFSLSAILIICTLVMGSQLNYVQKSDPGFNKDNIGYFQFPTAPWDPKLDAVKKELLNNPNIQSVTRVFFNYTNPLNIENPQGGFKWEGKDDGNDVLFYFRSADEDYAKTFHLEMKAGRYFSQEYPNDKSAIVINETAAGILGFNDPVGRFITSPDGKNLAIIGVVKDFHFRSMHYKIEPLIMQLGASNTLFIKMNPEHTDSTIAAVNRIYKSFSPSSPMIFNFLENDFDNLYRTERKISEIIGFFSVLAIIISCLGLFGLSSFIIASRTKEIGIRKTNGSGSAEIFYMISKEYLLLVIVSFLIACPFAFYSMNRWLQNFAYHVTLSARVFVLSALIVILLTLISVGIQSYRAALRNPVDALRYE